MIIEKDESPYQTDNSYNFEGKIGIIANAIAGKLDIDSVRALELFYESETCKHLHDKTTGLYLFGDLYIAEEFLQELQKRQ